MFTLLATQADELTWPQAFFFSVLAITVCVTMVIIVYLLRDA